MNSTTNKYKLIFEIIHQFKKNILA